MSNIVTWYTFIRIELKIILPYFWKSTFVILNSVDSFNLFASLSMSLSESVWSLQVWHTQSSWSLTSSLFKYYGFKSVHFLCTKPLHILELISLRQFLTFFLHRIQQSWILRHDMLTILTCYILQTHIKYKNQILRKNYSLYT